MQRLLPAVVAELLQLVAALLSLLLLALLRGQSTLMLQKKLLLALRTNRFKNVTHLKCIHTNSSG